MKNEECAGKMKNATENKEFDTMVRILKRNDLCTMVSDLPFKNDAVFCKIGHSDTLPSSESADVNPGCNSQIIHYGRFCRNGVVFKRKV